MKKKMNLNDPITSSSDIVLGDIVDAVAEHLGCPRAREAIGEAVKAALKNGRKVSGATVTPGIHTVTVTQGDDGLGVTLNGGAGVCGAVFGSSEDDLIKKGSSGCSPYYATKSKWFQKVLQDGEVWTPYTNRRFLPAQYLHLMHEFNGNMSKAVAVRYTMSDVFKLMDTEIEKLIWLANHWKTAFAERSQFLTVADCVKIFKEYLVSLRDNVNNRGLCTFSKRSGEFCRRIQGYGKVALWTYEKQTEEGNNGAVTVTEDTQPTAWLIKVNAQIEISLKKLAKCESYEKALSILRDDMPHVSMGTYKDQQGGVRNWIPKHWKECFLRAGAFYTLKSLVVNCHVRFTTEEGGMLRHRRTIVAESARAGRDGLHKLLRDNSPSYVIHAILKKSMSESGLDLGKFLRKISKR